MTNARRSVRRVIRSYKRFIKLYDARYAALVKGNTRDQLTAALIELVAGEGMDRASVREVATAAGVAIGTVQYHFPTRRDLLTGAFEAVVHGVRHRLALPAARADADPAATVVAILRELVPLDAPRRRETAVMVAFAAGGP